MNYKQPRKLPHQKLRVWQRAMELVKYVNARPPNDAELRNQATRAARSVGLNIAEGAPLAGKAQRRFFHIARCSVVEVVAAYELAEAIGESVDLETIQRDGDAIYAMLTKLMM